MGIKQLFKKWWLWLIIVMVILFSLFAPLFNCHLMKISNDTTVRQCQSLFDWVSNGPLEGLE